MRVDQGARQPGSATAAGLRLGFRECAVGGAALVTLESYDCTLLT
jgi:hypothetical protein